GDVAFLSDSAAATAQAEHLAAGMRLRLVPLAPATVERLSTADLTSRIDGLATEQAVADLVPALTGLAALVTCLQRPSLPLLRNINRVIEGSDVPWVCAFIDGPFVSIVGMKSRAPAALSVSSSGRWRGWRITCPTTTSPARRSAR